MHDRRPNPRTRLRLLVGATAVAVALQIAAAYTAEKALQPVDAGGNGSVHRVDGRR